MVEGLLEITKTEISVAEIAICNRLPFFISNIFGDIKMLAMKVKRLFEISEAVKSTAKATIRGTFSCRVSRIFGNFKVAFEVFYGLLA